MGNLIDTMNMTREVHVSPNASALIEGHRDFGYNLETALADIIDNSITANSSEVHLEVIPSSENPYIAIADNGTGVTESELIEAMRLGSKNPKDKRDSTDLGRFGLGLKSASFSQCRRLTVVTKKNGCVSCACWDLDYVSERNSWSLILIDNPEKTPGFNLLGKSGTLVVWEKIDRLTDGFDSNLEKRVSFLNTEFSRAERHLRLVFHRFIDGKSPSLNIYLNSRVLKAIDPMLAQHPSTQRDPEEALNLNNGTIYFRCYTLPHHKRMKKDEWDEVGGPEGHLRSQGLYIYRENRLIIAGGWLGLAKQTELTKLCRIAIDIPNTMDSDWKIDVKKASAQLPPLVRERLKKIIERFVGTSKRTYRSRGQKLVDETQHPLWNRVLHDGQVIFRPNLEHPVFKNYCEHLPDELKEGFYSCLRLVGAALPIETLHAELVGNAEAVSADTANETDLKELVYSLAATFINNGIPVTALPDTLLSNPFLRDNKKISMQNLKQYLKDKGL